MTDGTILGCLDDFKYHSKKVQLASGDLLYLYTDGVTEAFNIHDQLYGEKRLEDYLQTHMAHSIEDIVKESVHDVIEYSSGMPQSDDITLLAIKFNGHN
jgi:sigma-B regulation protein RsbU (phosphoserine phosphatase)